MLTVECSESSACNHGHRAPIAVHCLPEPADFSVKETLHRGTSCPQEKDTNKPGKQTQYDIIVTCTVHVILYLSNVIEYHIIHVLQTKISMVIFSASQRFSIEAHSTIDAL